ncbi:methyltransferase domain-containing protein (plasmid) [Paracoccus liaowanqingii]|uniref:Methyltransferase domain-containing protein n=1 Tax=Paracoccus liaowanqingii TaxID=2560053 RepID=A0A4Y5SU10_9RHOB|nr:methyltransferase domain-containing protein [Paracoccus liaowanqingii]
MRRSSLPRKDTLDHLTRLYQASDDPWDHRTSAYEAGKYAATLSALGPGPFLEALEIGCGNGTFAGQLAPRCTRLTVMDCIPAAIGSARRALAPLAQVTVIEGAAPQDLPRLRPDLVVLSEVLYFLTPDEIAELGRWLRDHATGPVIAVNWTGPTDEPLDGASAVALLASSLGPGATDLHDGFRIDRFDPSG